MTPPETPDAPPQRERFVITLEALPDGVPAEVRLRRLLKHALRALKLRCVGLREGPTEEERKP